MKASLLLPFMLAASSCKKPSDPPPSGGQAASDPFPPDPPSSQAARTPLPAAEQEAFELEEKADLSAWYDMDGQLKIEKVSGQKTDTRGSLAELDGFFEKQERKSLVVVVIAKNVLAETEMASLVSDLNNYFIRHGYRRVVIQQAQGGLSRGTHSDTARPGSQRPKVQRN